jgi:hypothetical protein
VADKDIALPLFLFHCDINKKTLLQFKNEANQLFKTF